MKLSELHAVEGDPVKGGCHVKKMGDVLDLNRQAFIDGRERPVVVLSVQPTVEQALEAELELKRARRAKADELDVPNTNGDSEA